MGEDLPSPAQRSVPRAWHVAGTQQTLGEEGIGAGEWRTLRYEKWRLLGRGECRRRADSNVVLYVRVHAERNASPPFLRDGLLRARSAVPQVPRLLFVLCGARIFRVVTATPRARQAQHAVCTPRAPSALRQQARGAPSPSRDRAAGKGRIIAVHHQLEREAANRKPAERCPLELSLGPFAEYLMKVGEQRGHGRCSGSAGRPAATGAVQRSDEAREAPREARLRRRPLEDVFFRPRVKRSVRPRGTNFVN